MKSSQKVIKIFAYLLAVAIIIGICSGIFNIVNTFIPTTEKVVVEDYYKEFKDVKEVHLDINAADLTVEEGETFSIKGEKLISKIKVQNENGVLKLKQNKIRINTQSAGTIHITVPSKLNKFYLNGGAGKIEIENLEAKKVKINLGFGNLKLKDIDFGKTKIDGGAGRIEIDKSTLKDLELEAGAGNIRINSKILGTSSIECGLGEIDLLLVGGEDIYKIKAEKGLGGLSINNKNYGDEVTYGDGENLISIDGGVGNILVHFQK